MPRLGINVPDELLNRLKPFKDSINVSQVCREALEERVAVYERAKARFHKEDLRDLVQRLAQEHALQEIDWEAMGHEDAKVWAELASLKDFEKLFYRLKFLKRTEEAIIPFKEGAKLFNDRWHENKEWVLSQFEYDEDANHLQKAKSAYELGWFSYVNVVWEKFQAKIADDARKVISQQREKLNEPIEVPGHLLKP